VPEYEEISKFPGTARDLAFVVKQTVPAQELLDAFHGIARAHAQGRIVQAIVLFDEYRGERVESDEKSLAFRFSLQDTQNTLQDDVVEELMNTFKAHVVLALGAKLRA
jgi:phenylalanyl-tRNA synthetase beta chain